MGGSSLRPLTKHLDRYLAASTKAERRAIAKELSDRYGETRTIVVTDMSRFSKTVATHGIVHYLALIRRCHQLLLPALRQAGGRVLRCEADNTYSVFDDSRQAVVAARDAQARFSRSNIDCAAEDRIGVGMGIGHGELLFRGATDAFGHEFNLASKLGEDISSGGQVLLTPAAKRSARLRKGQVARRTKKVSGLTIEYYELLL